jgi:DNA-binding transcriptional LysR family regulator
MAKFGLSGQLKDADLRLLNIFAAVAECGGFAAAEVDLNINRSTISTHISDLETRLGMRLCQRSRGRSAFSLTDQGKAVYDEVKLLQDYTQNFRARISAIQSNMTGRLSLALPDDWLEMSEASFDLAPVIARFRRQAPAVTLDIVTRAPHEMDFDLLSGKVDVGINTALVKRPGLKYLPIFDHHSHLYCSDQHPLYDKPPEQLTTALIAQYDLVASGHKGQIETRNLTDLFPNKANADHMEGCLLMILTGHYLGFLPDYYAAAKAEHYRLRRLLPTVFHYRAKNAVVYKKAATNAVITSFVQLLVDAIRAA